MGSARSYRSKVEVLRDFLRAAQQPAPKTRIIGAANLNPVSFRRYLRLCTERDLITTVSGGYVATPRATPLLEAIDGLMAKASELEDALHALEYITLEGRTPDGGGGNPFRQLLREAWNEFTLRPAPSLNGRRRPVLLAAIAGPDRSAAPRGRSSDPVSSPVVATVPSVGGRSRSRSPATGDRERRLGPGSRTTR